MKSWITMASVVVALVLTTGAARADTSLETANRAVVESFFNMAWNDKDYAGASRLLSARFTEHSPTMADGPSGLKAAVQELKARYPQARSEIKRILTDGDNVVLHVHTIREAGDRGQASFEMYRLMNGKITEHWSVRANVPERQDPNNHNTMF